MRREMEAAQKLPQQQQFEMSPSPDGAPEPRRFRRQALFAPELMKPAFKQAFVMLRPDIQWANPVMFVVEVGAVLTLLFVIQAAISSSSSQVTISYFIALDFWLFLTVCSRTSLPRWRRHVGKRRPNRSG